MKRAATVFLCGLLSFATTLAQNGGRKPAGASTDAKRAEQMPTAEQVLERYVRAIGGREAIEKVKTWVKKGSFELTDEMVASVEFYEKAPNKFVHLVSFPGGGYFQEGFDGTVAWEKSAQDGLREITGPPMVWIRREADFHREIKLKQLYPIMSFKGKRKVRDIEAYVIEVSPADGKSEFWYFDSQTGLLLRRDDERTGGEDQVIFVTEFGDYREVGGLKVAHTIWRSSPSRWTIKFREITPNAPVDDLKLSKPASDR